MPENFQFVVSPRRLTSSSMVASIFYSLSLIWNYLITALLSVFVKSDPSFPADLEQGIGIEDRVPSPVPSKFSMGAESVDDYPAYVAPPPPIHHGRQTFNDQHAFLLDIPNLYWTETTTENRLFELGPTFIRHRRWCVATREEYYRALQQRESVADWLWGQHGSLPHLTTAYPSRMWMGPTGSYRKSDGEWDTIPLQ